MQVLNEVEPMRYAFAVFTLSVFLALVAPPAVQAREFRPVVIYQGDIEGNAYNSAVHEGVRRFVEKIGDPCEERVVGADAEEYEKALERAAGEGCNPVIILYGDQIANLSGFIQKYPQTRFIGFGAKLDAPNLFSLDFAEHEGAFLAGALAAMVSKTKTIGFVSVCDQPLSRRFACGYEQGARYVDPGVVLLTAFMGCYRDAWIDQAGAAKLADSLMDQGADVIFQAAGGAGMGVLDACATRGRLAIGVDRNQNGVHPGNVLTSMIKKADQVVFAALLHAKRDIWRDNLKTFGLAQDALDLAFDKNNAGLVSPELRKRIEGLRSDVILGKIRVHDYAQGNICP